MIQDTRLKLQECLEGIVRENSLQLVDLFIKQKGRILSIVVLADRPMGGITIEECTVINRRFVEAVEQQQLVYGDYTVEVSSPGLDRPLKTKEDFRRVLGRSVHFYLSERIEEKWEQEGVVKEITEDNVVIELNSHVLALALDKINKAVQVI